MGRKKKIISITEPKISEYDIVLQPINDPKETTKDWMRGFSLSENETLESCYKQYEKIYNHKPVAGWIYTNTLGHKIIYLQLEKGDK